MTSEAIVFAIHSAIRLSANFRQAYANSLKNKRLVLPLPKFSSTPDLTTAQDFFEEPDNKVRFVNQVSDLERIHQEVLSKPEDQIPKKDRKTYLEYYKSCWQVVNGKLEGYSPDDFASYLVIRQWIGKAPGRRPLQLIAGTLVDVGVDFFTQVPGALNTHSTAGKFLKSFLSGVDKVDFGTGENIKSDIVRLVVPQLFVASAETLENVSGKIGHDPKFQVFIQDISQGLTADIGKRIEAMSTAGDRTTVVEWGRLLFRSMVKNAGEYVFTDPHDSIGTGSKESELIKEVGQTLMSILLDEDPISKVRFKDLFTIDGLDKVVKSALTIVAQYPTLLADKNGFKQIVQSVAAALATSGINRPALLPDVLRLVMINTAGNLERLTKTEQGQSRHLLVTALKDVLMALAPKEGDEKWRPNLNNTDILNILEDVFDEVVANPQWLESKVTQGTLLSAVLTATYNALAGIPEGDRLNGKTLRLLIMLGLRTAATNNQVLSRIKWGDGQVEGTILNRALDIIFAFTFDKKSTVDKVDLVYQLTDYVLQTIITKHPNAHGLVLTQLILTAQANALTEHGFDKETANLLMQAALKVINEHPELITDNKAFENIIAGVAGAWSKMNIHQPQLLSDLIRVTLVSTAGNLDLLIPSTTGAPKHLAVIALEDILTALSNNAPGKWRPNLTHTDLIRLVTDLLDEVVHNPSWITDKVSDKPVFSQILNANFTALSNIPPEQRLSGAVVQMLIELSLRTAASNAKVLQQIKWGSGQVETTILNKALDLIFAFVFSDSSAGDRSTLLIELVDYILQTILVKYPNEIGLTLILNILSKDLGVILTAGGINKTKIDDLVNVALEAIAAHPELVSGNEDIAMIISSTADTLKNSGLALSEMLPEFIRLILEKTAGNLTLLIDTRKRKQKLVLILALQQTLKAIAARPASGKWKPALTVPQIYEIVAHVFEYIIQNPQWIKNDLLRDLLNVVFKSIEHVPNSQPVSYLVVKTLIDHALKAVSLRKQLMINLINTDGSQQKIALAYTLDGFFVALYDKSGGTVGSWTLTQGPTLEAIIEVFLLRISGKAVTKEDLDAALSVVTDAIQDLNANKDFLLEAFLRTLGDGLA